MSVSLSPRPGKTSGMAADLGDKITKPEREAPSRAKAAADLYVTTVTMDTDESAFPSDSRVRQVLDVEAARFLVPRGGMIWAQRYIHLANKLGPTVKVAGRQVNDAYAMAAGKALSRVASKVLKNPNPSDGSGTPTPTPGSEGGSGGGGGGNTPANNTPPTRTAGLGGNSALTLVAGLGLLSAGGYAVMQAQS